MVGIGLLATPAGAVPGETDTGSTTANVDIATAITLTNLTAAFTLSGIPGDVATTGASPVSMRVTTNNAEGYSVTVQPAAATLVGALPGNTDTIAATALQVSGPKQGAGVFAPLTVATATEVTNKITPSVVAGDVQTNAYRMTIPAIAPDTYSVTLNYVATTL